MLRVREMPAVAARPNTQPVINAIELEMSMADRLFGRDSHTHRCDTNDATGVTLIALQLRRSTLARCEGACSVRAPSPANGRATR
jgi:hypothetical protein